MYIQIIDQTNKLTEQTSTLIQEVLSFAANYLELDDSVEMSVTLVDNPKIQEINKIYRNKDYATDVISFAMNDMTEDDPLQNMDLDDDEFGFSNELGDLFISIDKMKEQASDYGHSEERELAFLVVHGFLHLNGYDHLTKEDENEMFSLQETILSEFGVER